MMKERPILFSGAMVRAILRGENPKTQTRRECSTQRDHFCDFNGLGNAVFTNDEKTYTELRCPYGLPGDRLWVREAWSAGADEISYKERAGKWIEYFGPDHPHHSALRKYYDTQRGEFRPSIHMPRWASRILLEVVSVRVERLQAISEADAIAEGIVKADGYWTYEGTSFIYESALKAYRALWESINGPGSWEENPWVWVVEFRRVLPV